MPALTLDASFCLSCFCFSCRTGRSGWKRFYSRHVHIRHYNSTFTVFIADYPLPMSMCTLYMTMISAIATGKNRF